MVSSYGSFNGNNGGILKGVGSEQGDPLGISE